MTINTMNSTLANALSFLFVCAPALAVSADEGDRSISPWTAKASVELRYFLSNDDFVASVDPALPVVASPNGDLFAIKYRRADLRQDKNVWGVHIYRKVDVEGAVRDSNDLPLPLATFELGGRSISRIIGRLFWNEDSSGFWFFGEGDENSFAGRCAKFYFSIHEKRLYEVADCRQGNVILGSSRSGSSAAYLSPTIDPDLIRLQELDIAAKMYGYPKQLLTPDALREVLRPASSKVSADKKLFDRLLNATNPKFELMINDHGVLRDAGISFSFGRRLSDIAGMRQMAWFSDGARRMMLFVPASSRLLEATDSEITGPFPIEFLEDSMVLIDVKSGQIDSIFNGYKPCPTPYKGPLKSPPNIWTSTGHAYLCSIDREGNYDKIAVFDDKSHGLTQVASLNRAGIMATGVRWDDQRNLAIDWNLCEMRPKKNCERVERVTFGNTEGAWEKLRISSRLKIVNEPNPPWRQATEQLELRKAFAKESGLDEIGRPLAYPVGSWIDYPEAQPFSFDSGLKIILEEGAARPQRLIAEMNGRRSCPAGWCRKVSLRGWPPSIFW